jgi:hypothetical protein
MRQSGAGPGPTDQVIPAATHEPEHIHPLPCSRHSTARSIGAAIAAGTRRAQFGGGFKRSVGRVSRDGIVLLIPSQDSPGPAAVAIPASRDADGPPFGIRVLSAPGDDRVVPGAAAIEALVGLRV